MCDSDMEVFSDERFEKTKSYWTALGRFIHYFSQVEQKLQTLLWRMTGTSLEVARAAFQDARHGAIITLINRINDSKGVAENDSYRVAVDRLGPIARMRNDIVHLAPNLENGTAIISNTDRAMPGRAVEKAVSVKMLDDMCSDLLTIMAHLSVFSLETSDDADPLLLEYWRTRTRMRAWHYKPPPQSGVGQVKPNRKRHSNSQAPKRQQPPSQK